MKIGSSITLSSSQFNKPAPQGYRNFSNAMIIFLLPAFTVLISGWGLSDKMLNHVLLVTSFIPAAIKGIGTMLGNGQYYTTDVKSAIDPLAEDKEKAAQETKS